MVPSNDSIDACFVTYRSLIFFGMAVIFHDARDFNDDVAHSIGLGVHSRDEKFGGSFGREIVICQTFLEYFFECLIV